MSWRVCLLWEILAAMLANKTFIYSQTTLGHRFVNKRPVGKLATRPIRPPCFYFLLTSSPKIVFAWVSYTIC
jgi:hypothetical protein